MTVCILIITLAGEVIGCLPPEYVAAMDQPDQWNRLLAALEQAKERAND